MQGSLRGRGKGFAPIVHLGSLTVGRWVLAMLAMQALTPTPTAKLQRATSSLQAPRVNLDRIDYAVRRRTLCRAILACSLSC